VTRTEKFYTVHPGQTTVEIQVYQGESTRVKDNHLLGEFLLQGLKQRSMELADILVRFDFDVNGLLQVAAVEKDTGRQAEIVLQATHTRLSAAEKSQARQQVQELLAAVGDGPGQEQAASARRLVQQARALAAKLQDSDADRLADAADELESLLTELPLDAEALDEAEEELADLLYDLED
jgi:molecular chaperone DnaK (HSP70)